MHNQLRGRKVPHPESTNFNERAKGFPTPHAKRVKKEGDVFNRKEVEQDDVLGRSTPTPSSRSSEIPDSEDEDEEDLETPQGHPTLLETSLPPIETDREAIEEYEAYRAGQSEQETIHDRLGARSWSRGKSSIYVDAFNLALETVLEEERHLFDDTELALIEHWKKLNYQSQYLYVRLFLRKTSAWHRISRLGYYSDIADLDTAVVELQNVRPLPAPETESSKCPINLSLPEVPVLGNNFSFAECSEREISTLEEASSLLLLDELKLIAKDAKVQGKTKKDLLAALRRTSSRQKGLSFRRSDTEESAASNTSYPDDEKFDSMAELVNRDAHYTRKILDHTGKCVRLSLAPLKLFERIHLVFYRSTEWTEKSLTTIILAKISRRNFPEYLVSRSATIFPSRALLLEFEASIRLQFRVDNILEFSGTPGVAELEEVKSIFEAVYPRWKELVDEEQRRENGIYESGEGAYLRRFSPAWVYTRVIHKGLYPLSRFKEHKREHEILTGLLDQKLFHAARRGAWYQRKALLEEHYLWALYPSASRGEEAQKKHWKRIALRSCEEGLQDRDCHIIYHYDLQKRIKKLEKALKLPLREQHDFGHAMLVKPYERTVEGIRVEKEPTPLRHSRRNSDGLTASPTRRSAKTIWIDTREGGGECSVEGMCLSWYRDQGWKGYHSEGGLVRTLFGYMFYDVLFTYVPNVFQTEYQTCPLDLHTDAFYPSRYSEINYRLMEISNGQAERILKQVHAEHFEKRTCCVGINWDFELEDLVEIVRCFEGEALSTICKVMAQEYQARGGGVPDLFLWHPEKRQVMFAEVKSENDRLSDTQRLWIHVLMGAGIQVELCHAVAKEVRIVR
ncbi:putative coiled-coil domain-containing protein mtmr15 [Phaeomoniella chlamydospora]|uniref:Fanconi-associated nuclease n=1 Tax=Phaeomoniella chlamydospora TaxID=158046 RepID=A0A0G2H9P8_PHACM|nr:putative coiled-coil domain-containing protein mtmr15 [Phaeomoniella chlamydospora]